jgi:hypothetical protein
MQMHTWIEAGARLHRLPVSFTRKGIGAPAATNTKPGTSDPRVLWLPAFKLLSAPRAHGSNVTPCHRNDHPNPV